jgi:hypothetical protein
VQSFNTFYNKLPLFAAVKVTALFLVICMVLVSVFTGRANVAHVPVTKSCCHKMMQKQPCQHQQKNDCGQGMCVNMLSCNSCGFLKVDPVSVAPIVPTLKETSMPAYQLGSLSAYSLSSWRPPKV